MKESCPTRCPACGWFLDVALLPLRGLLGYLLLHAGYLKLFTMGVENFYQHNFLAMKPSWLPGIFGWPYGHAVPFLEFGVGAALILGLLGRLSAGGAFLMISSFTIAMAGAMPDALTPPKNMLLHQNYIYIMIALLLAATGPGRISLDKLIGWRCCCCRGKKDDRAVAVPPPSGP